MSAPPADETARCSPAAGGAVTGQGVVRPARWTTSSPSARAASARCLSVPRRAMFSSRYGGTMAHTGRIPRIRHRLPPTRDTLVEQPLAGSTA